MAEEMAKQGEFLALRASDTAVLVVDVQNDYCSPDGAFDRAGQDIRPLREVVPRIHAFLQAAYEAQVRVVYVQNTSDPAAQMLTVLQRQRRMRTARTVQYVVEGTWGQEFATPLGPRPGDLLIRKYASSAFVGTPLDQALRALRVSTVLVTGVVTWGCVMATAQSAAFKGYVPLVVTDCVAGNDGYLHEAALAMMRRSFGEELVVPSGEVIQRLSLGG